MPLVKREELGEMNPFISSGQEYKEAKVKAEAIELSDKDRRIVRQGCWQAAVQSDVLRQYLYTQDIKTLPELLDRVKELADAGVKYTLGE